MIVSQEIDQIRRLRWADSAQSWGFVPTMGYLHEGHLSLVRLARKANERVAVSIYVNPTQFAPQEDLSTYPRNLDRDLALLEAEGVDLAFTPDDDLMYPAGFQTTVSVQQITHQLEGASRPTHFQGVTTIVSKLFHIIQPTRAYFGQKDAQQTVVIQRMVRDLNFNIEIVIGPIIREADGLALSSRNVRLSPEQRRAAPILYQALQAAEQAWLAGERDGSVLRRLMRDMIDAESLAWLDYVSVADPDSLTELEQIEGGALFSLAVFFAPVRLIDNCLVSA